MNSLGFSDHEAIENLFKEYSTDIKLIIHTAAQPSHDSAAQDPHLDFTINVNGTLVLLSILSQKPIRSLFHR